MSLIKVKEYLKKYNMDNRIIEFDTSSATVSLAAKALNCKEEKIAKSLSFKTKDKVILIVVKGDSKIDNKKYKNEFKEKAHMLPFDEVENLIGHEVGGVCPFAVNSNVEVYLDNSLKKFDTVFPACGSHNSAIEVTIEELEKTTNFIKWIDVTKEI